MAEKDPYEKSREQLKEEDRTNNTSKADSAIAAREEQLLNETREWSREQNNSGMVAGEGLLPEKEQDRIAGKSNWDKYINEEAFTIPDTCFSLPEMGDFYLGAVDTKYLGKLGALVEGSESPGEKHAANAAFYTETPTNTRLSCGDGSAFIRVPANKLMSAGGFMDGGTLRASIADIDAGDDTKKFFNKALQGNKSFDKLTNGDCFEIQMYGIDVPTTARWAEEIDVPIKSVQYKAVVVNEMSENKVYYLISTPPKDGSEMRNFVLVGAQWHEMDIISVDDEKISFRWLVSPGADDEKLAERAQESVMDYINKGDGYVYLQVDCKAGNGKSTKCFGQSVSDDIGAKETLKKWAGSNTSGKANGYCLSKEDESKLTGVAYIKVDGKWINLAKALLIQDDTGTTFNNDFTGEDKKAFPQNYDQEAQVFADAYIGLIKDIDDRRTIQQGIFGQDFEDLLKWNVMIGDVMLFIPPTSIQVISEVEEYRQPLLRASGSMAKNGRMDTRTIAMSLYFYGDKGINGFKLEQKSPSGEKFNYSLNGLRALISEFKFTPFLPLDNDYLNNVLGIHAVTFNNLSLQSVPGHPKLIEARITMTEFSYEAYLPEVATMCETVEYDGNWFATAFNWATMRYYYQRSIMAGDHMSEVVERNNKKGGVNSDEYIKESLKNRTALQPMAFKSSEMKLYIADTEYLQKMLDAKRERNKKYKLSLNLTDDQKKDVEKVGRIHKKVMDQMGSLQANNNLTKLNGLPIVYDWNGEGVIGNKSSKTNLSQTKKPTSYSEGNSSLNSAKGVNPGFKLLNGNGEPAADESVNKLIEDTFSLVELPLKTDSTVSDISYDVRYVTANEGNIENGYLYFGMVVGLKDVNTDDLRKTYMYAQNKSTDTILQDGKIFIPLAAQLGERKVSPEGRPYYELKSDIVFSDQFPDLQLGQFCVDQQSEGDKDLAEADKENGNGITNWRKAVDLNQLDNMSFIPYECGDYVVGAWSASLQNHLTSFRGRPVTLLDISGSVPQYLGGEDITFEVAITTTNRDTVSAFTGLPKYTGQIMRQYREVIPCSPLKIDSEFTRLLGVNEVSIDHVDIGTVPGQPGVYSITLSMRSVDRTLRNREALQMIEANNAGNRYEEGFGEKTTMSYFEIEDLIAQAELYPDLELPTLSEMTSLGWDFVRYKFQDSRTYVDPDFYFVYLSQLSSQLLRDLIIESVDNGVDGSATYQDVTGAMLTTVASKYCGYTTTAHNEALTNQLKQVKDAEDIKYKIDTKKVKEKMNKEMSNSLIEDYEGWDICTDIKSMFLEPRYKKEYDAYIQRRRNEIASGKATAQKTGQTESETEAQTNIESSASETKIGGEIIATKDAKKTDKESVVETTVSREKTSGEAAASKNTKEAINESANEENVNNDNSSSTTTNGETQSEEIPVPASFLFIGQKAIDYANGLYDDDGTVKMDEKSTSPDGKWVCSQLQDAASASCLISAYIYSTPIPCNVPDKNSIREMFKNCKNNGTETDNCYKAIKTAVNQTVNKFLREEDIRRILELLNIDVSDSFINATQDIVFSAACAATAKKEFSNKKNATRWMPAPDFIGIDSGNGLQDSTSGSEFNNADNAVLRAKEFGIFRIKQYERKEFLNITGENPEDVWDDSTGSFNTTHWLIDRYYRYLPEEDIEKYKKGCINSVEYCTYAYLRNMLYWLKKLIDIQAYPSINADVLRKATHTEQKIQDMEKTNGVDTEKNKVVQDHLKFFTKNIYTIDAGKMWTASVLASTDGDKKFINRIEKRDYRALNEYVHGVSVPESRIPKDDEVSMTVRKMNLALIGIGRIKDANARGVPQDLPAVKAARDITEKKYIDAAEDPKQYMVHACHDMIVHDARGRMLRAFPTYYILFIDEGREAGNWHLHDNFYNSSAILEFSIVKDRKNPADTANIIMSNMYQAFQTEDEDRIRYQEGSWGAALESVFRPDKTGAEQEAKRRGSSVQDNVRIRPGARIHLRAGYGANAAMMPVLFNGSIAEVTAEDTVNIIAQGDGIELTNPIPDDYEAQEVENNIKHWLSNGATPKKIMNNLLTYEGGSVKTILKKAGYGNLLGDNPYGIYHFGDKNFKSIVSTGEPTQNIYEAWAKPVWGEMESKDTSDCWFDKGAPEITFDILGKTVWDIANICRSVMPDFVCGVAPFDFRSTLFIGAPRYYYAYSYVNINGAIQEKRKPFQQFHVYTSGCDIIQNGIAASSKYLKTNASGLYQVTGGFNTKEQHVVGPLYADIDIFPEDQKSMIVDTQLLGKGPSITGAVFTNALTSFEAIDGLFDEEGSMVNHKAIAWRMTASALKDSVKEMYQGDMVVIGDPSVKPHDRMFIMDNYNQISGQATVKEVVHHMSVDTGFVTTISPDCINVVDDKFETIVHHWWNAVGGTGASHLACMAYIAAALKMKKVPGVATVAGKGKDLLNKINETVGKKVVNGKTMTEWAKLGAEEAKDAGKWAGEQVTKAGRWAVGEAENVKSNSKLIRLGARVVKAGAKAASAIGAAGTAVAGAGAAAGTALGIAALPEILVGLAGTLAVVMTLETIGQILSNAVTNYLKNLQVLTVYPLFHHNLAWTAGMAGSKGMIYGSPSYNEQGKLTELLSGLVSPDNAVGAFLSCMLFDDDATAEADRLKRHSGGDMLTEENKGLFSSMSEKGAPLSKNLQGNIYSSVCVSGNTSAPSSWNGLIMGQRANCSNKSDFYAAYIHFAMLEPQKLQDDPKLDNFSLISDFMKLKPYIESEPMFLRIAHGTPELNEGQSVTHITIERPGREKFDVNYIESDDENGNLVYDVPMLSSEALTVLYEIVSRTQRKMPASADDMEYYNQIKDSYLFLESALRVGDKTSMASTGYGFVIRGVGICVEKMQEALEDMEKEINEYREKYPDIEFNVFESIPIDSSNQKVEKSDRTYIKVFLPKITESSNNNSSVSSHVPVSPEDLPSYDGNSPYTTVNGNVPDFEDSDMGTESFERFGDLDSLGRCTTAYACIGPDSLPTENRGPISQVKPTGWQNEKYDILDGENLYNRCHLIGYQLSAEDANPKNLITGTRYLNVDGMLPFENKVTEYIKSTGNHVMYRVTPIFSDSNLVADGVEMEAKSVEDDGTGVSFHVYCYNVQPKITIDYATGSSHVS